MIIDEGFEKYTQTIKARVKIKWQKIPKNVYTKIPFHYPHH